MAAVMTGALGGTPVVQLGRVVPQGAADTCFTDQLRNADSLVGHRDIGRELLEQMDRPIDVFCAAVGAGHTVVTVAVDTGLKYLDGDLYAGSRDGRTRSALPRADSPATARGPGPSSPAPPIPVPLPNSPREQP